MNRIVELILGLLVVAACILAMSSCGGPDVDVERSYRNHRATIAAEQQWGAR